MKQNYVDHKHIEDRENGRSAKNDSVILACSSLSRELGQVLRDEKLVCDLRFVDALLCLRPWELRDALEEKLRALSQAYHRVWIVYGMCAPDIDCLASSYGACRIPAAHCYELLAGPRFRDLLQQEIGTYFLSPSLCHDFQRRIVDGMGLGVAQSAREIIFARYKRVVYLQTERNTRLDDKARQAATYLGLPLQIEYVGLTNFRRQILRLLSNNEDQAEVRL